MRNDTVLAVLAVCGGAFALAACGSDGGKPTTGEGFPDLPTVDGVGLDDVAPEDVGESDGGPPPPEDVEDADVPPDVPPCETECCADVDCAGIPIVPPADIDPQYVALSCIHNVCEEGACVQRLQELCCETDAHCTGQVETDVCTLALCKAGTCKTQKKALCCLTDSDCNPYADGCCTTATCGKDNVCDVATKDECCKTDSDCEAVAGGESGVCAQACVQDGCTYPFAGCTTDVVYVDQGFDAGAIPFAISDLNPTDEVGVKALAATSATPAFSAYFGDPACKSYYTGPMKGCAPADPFAGESYAVDLALTTKPVTLAADVPSWVGFWVHMAAEPQAKVDLGEGDVLLDTDFLVVEVISGGKVETVWRSTDPDAFGSANTTGGKWRFQAANLAAWQGQSVTLRFRFVTDGYDDWNNSPSGEPWYGAYLDGIRASTLCTTTTCAKDLDCGSDGDACTADTCTSFAIGAGGVCGRQVASPGEPCTACDAPSDCGQDPCLAYACDGGKCSSSLKGECCSPASTFPLGAVEGVVELEGFEGGDLKGWQIVDPHPEDAVTWQVHEVLPFQGAFTLYFGDPASETYASTSGKPAKGTAWTPYFPVSDDALTNPVVSFWLWLSTEYDGAIVPPGPDDVYDTLSVQVESLDAATTAEVWRSTAAPLGGSTHGGWKQIGIPLDDFAGHTLRLGFTFDSVDQAGNDYGGVRIDDLTVTSICDDECVSFGDCDDGNACTADWCDLGSCVSVQEDANCCTVLADCNDGNNCTIDACTDGACTHQYNEAALATCCSAGPWLGTWTADFEDGADGFTSTTDSPPVAWHLSSTTAHSGLKSFTFSDPATGTYLDGKEPVSGELLSQVVHVPPFTLGTNFAEFWFFLETEWDEIDLLTFDDTGLFTIDDLTVEVAVDGAISAALEHWWSGYVKNTTGGAWVRSRVDLSDYKGHDVQLVFRFDSGDGKKNAYAGPFVDDVSFGTSCQPAATVQCIYGGDCETEDVCFQATCTDTFACVEAPIPGLPECCVPFVVDEMTMSFETDLEAAGWTVETCKPGGTNDVDADVTWQSATQVEAAGIDPECGQHVLYLGNGTNIGGGSGSCADAWSPPVTLEAGVPWSLQLSTFVDVEALAAPQGCVGGGPNFSDVFRIEVEDLATGKEHLVFDKSFLECNEYDDWADHTLDLTPYAGTTFRFHFSFDSWDGISNFGSGIAIDCMEFVKGCAEPPP